MKKQINPTIKAQILRSAFILLSLVAVCAIPFALAQRNSTKRSAAKQSAVATAQKTVPLSTGAVPGTLPAKPASGSITATDQSQLLPFDVRRPLSPWTQAAPVAIDHYG